MTAHAVSVLSVLATEGGEGGGHENINPILNGVVAFAILLVLLFITTRLNRDR
jgi:hypothetical protein